MDRLEDEVSLSSLEAAEEINRVIKQPRRLARFKEAKISDRTRLITGIK